MCDMTHPCDLLVVVEMAHSYVQYDLFICAPWLIHMCAMTHSHVGHDTPWFIYMWDMTMSLVTRMTESVRSHIWVSHVTHINESHHTCEWVMSHARMRHFTHRNESCHTHLWVTAHPSMRHYYTRQQHLLHEYHTRTSANWMSHGTYEWVMVHMNESWHIWMSHGTYEHARPSANSTTKMPSSSKSLHAMSHGTYE